MLNYYGLPIPEGRLVYSTGCHQECDPLEILKAGPIQVVISPETDERLEALSQRKSLRGILIARQARLAS